MSLADGAADGAAGGREDDKSGEDRGPRNDRINRLHDPPARPGLGRARSR